MKYTYAHTRIHIRDDVLRQLGGRPQCWLLLRVRRGNAYLFNDIFFFILHRIDRRFQYKTIRTVTFNYYIAETVHLLAI